MNYPQHPNTPIHPCTHFAALQAELNRTFIADLEFPPTVDENCSLFPIRDNQRRMEETEVLMFSLSIIDPGNGTELGQYSTIMVSILDDDGQSSMLDTIMYQPMPHGGYAKLAHSQLCGMWSGNEARSCLALFPGCMERGLGMRLGAAVYA